MTHRTRAALTAILLASIVAALACSSGGDETTSAESGSEEGAQAAADAGSQAQEPAEAAGAYALKQTVDMGIEVTSPVFNRIRRIPKTHVCPGRAPKAGTSFEQDALTKYADRKNTSPPIEWTGAPDGTQSIAVMMDSDQIAHAEDPDVRFTHWLIWNLPPETSGLAEKVATTTDVAALGPDTRQGTNDDEIIGYSGPCPLPITVGYFEAKPKVVFEYLFHVYALDTTLDLPGTATRDDFMKAIDGHVLSGGVVRGEFVASRQLLEH